MQSHFFSLFRDMLVLLSMAVPPTARVPFVMTAAASIRVGRVQVQKIDLDNMLLGIHLIQVIHHSNDSFGTFYLKALYLLLVSYC